MTRRLLLLGGRSEDIVEFAGLLRELGAEFRHEPCVQHLAEAHGVETFDAVVALDCPAIRGILNQPIIPGRSRVWLAFVNPGDTQAHTEAQKGGAHTLILQGANPRLLKIQLQKLLEYLQAQKQNTKLKARLRLGGHCAEWVARTLAMKSAGAMIRRVAQLRTPLLIHGETGTGRSHLAKLIHQNSQRQRQPVVELDCASIESSKLGASLFGKEQSTFAGSETETHGVLSAADQGTLILENLGALPEILQTMLLEFLQTGCYRRIGSSELERSDVRVIAISDKNLEERVHDRQFRLDLFQALHGVRMTLPPLRERRAEIAPLILHFLEQDKDLCFPPVTGISREALSRFVTHDWPGNVRELRETLRTACALSDGPVITQWKPGKVENHPADRGETSQDGIDICRPLAELTAEAIETVERDYLERVLRRFKGQIAPTARHSGLCRNLVRNKMTKYGLVSEQFRGQTR